MVWPKSDAFGPASPFLRITRALGVFLLNSILQHLHNEGYPIRDFIPDGKPQRFEIERGDRQAGFYIAHRNFLIRTGEEYYFVQYGSWRDGIDNAKTFSTLKGILTNEDRHNLDKQINKDKKALDKIREEGYEFAAEEVAKKWESLSPNGTHEYLNRKKISDCPDLGVRYDNFNEALYVPLRDGNGKLWSLQKIDRNGKRFHPGGRVRGNFHIIGNPGNKLFICEGFATACSVHLATHEAVIVGFDSGNLKKVSSAIKGLYPEKTIVLCGDEDKYRDENVGRKHAEEAAKTICSVALFPVFKDESTHPSDWNDLHVLEGLQAVKMQIEETKVEKKAVYALGFKEGEYFFTSTQNRQVVPLSAFSEKDFLHLMTLDYWEANFPGKTERSRVDWTAARSNLMQTARQKGIFQPYQVRGAGVWTDDGRIVVNMGDHLIIDGTKTELGHIRSRYFYTLGKSLPIFPTEDLTSNECSLLLSACSKFRWAKQDSGILLAGALVLSRVCGALPIRPHTWVTGGALTGKTTILEKLIKTVMGDSKLYVQGNTTEAAVRQMLKADAIPVLFDEFETSGRKSDENISSLIELMRASWSDSNAIIAKGGSSGNASYFQVRFSAIVSSIRTKLTNDADRGRFAILELAPHGSDQTHWTQLSSVLSHIDTEYSERLFARTVRMLPTLLENYRVIKRTLAQKVDSRFGDQYGMLLAGYSILIWDRIIDEADAKYLSTVEVELSEEQDTAKTADHDDALTHLLTTKITYDTGVSRKDCLIGELISQVSLEPYNSEDAKKALLFLGIRVDSEVVSVVSANHAELEAKVWRGTKWSQIWGNSLKRLPGAEKHKPRFSQKTQWAIKIPLQTILN